MKRHYIILLTLLFFITISENAFSSESNPLKKLKRTVAILPFYNLKKDKNDFYSNLIRDSIKARLQEKLIYNLIEFGEIKKNMDKYNYDLESLNLDEQKAGNFAKSLKADIVIYGTFVVQKESINISVTAYDIIFKKSIITITENGNTGLEIFNLININIGQNLADKMSNRVTMIDQTIFDEIADRTKYIIEENDRDIINKLLKEKEKYVQVDISIQGTDFPLAIPRGYNVIIFIKDEPGIFEIKYNDEIYQSNSIGLKIMVFENEIGAKRTFNLIKDQSESMIYEYVQKKDSEITIKRIRFKKDKIRFTMLRNEKIYLISSSASTGLSGLILLSGIITSSCMSYYIDLYNKTPIEQPEKISEYKNNVYSLFPASLVLLSLGGALIIPSVIFWSFYGYCLFLKKHTILNTLSFEMITGNKFIELSIKVKFM
ncbi:MAG: hypothetical protein JXB50_12595 [Spirochaetes bacterium]|nr:hypothetical protein [Spirochaetota bacterium]